MTTTLCHFQQCAQFRRNRTGGARSTATLRRPTLEELTGRADWTPEEMAGLHAAVEAARALLDSPRVRSWIKRKRLEEARRLFSKKTVSTQAAPRRAQTRQRA